MTRFLEVENAYSITFRSIIIKVYTDLCICLSELNHSVKEMAYQEIVRGKYEVWRGGEVESVEKEW